MIQLRTLTQDDAEQFRELRLEALRTNPEAFSASYEDAAEQPLEAVKARMLDTADSFILGAFDSAEAGRLVGMVGFYRNPKTKLSHKGHIWGTYVTPDYRGKGAGKQLMEGVVARAGRIEGLLHLNLEVVASNEGAVGLYRSVGFRGYGLERDALRWDGRLYDEELMKYVFDRIGSSMNDDEI